MEDKHFLTEFWWKKILTLSIFFHTWSEPDKLLHFYFCRWHGTKRRYDDHEKGMLLLLLGMQEKFYKRRWLPFGIHMKRIIGLGTLLLCRLFRIINMAADSLRTTTNSMFELFINFQHSSTFQGADGNSQKLLHIYFTILHMITVSRNLPFYTKVYY